MRADAGAGAHDVGDAGRNQRLRLHGAAYLKQLEKKIHKLKTFKIKIKKKTKKKTRRNCAILAEFEFSLGPMELQLEMDLEQMEESSRQVYTTRDETT